MFQHDRGARLRDLAPLEFDPDLFSTVTHWGVSGCHSWQCLPFMQFSGMLDGLLTFSWEVDSRAAAGFLDQVPMYNPETCMRALGERATCLLNIRIQGILSPHSFPFFWHSDASGLGYLRNCPLESIIMRNVQFMSHPDLLLDLGHWPDLRYLSMPEAIVDATFLQRLAAARPSLRQVELTIIETDPPYRDLSPLPPPAVLPLDGMQLFFNVYYYSESQPLGPAQAGLIR
jgi:hypothetical protein